MIEVIKHGNQIVKNKKIITKCNECGCIFSFIDNDPYLGGDLKHHRIFCKDYVYCPDCGNEIAVHDTSCFSDSNEILCEVVEETSEFDN